MDSVARYNLERWHRLAQANALFTRPYLDLDPAAARSRLDPDGRLGDLSGKDVLCLAGGGGQQSAAFALLGANVTVFDLSSDQLDRDRQAAAHYQIAVTTVQGDMRDLSHLAAAAFDVVWHPYSLNFVPDARQVFRQVARVLRPGSLYHFNCANPFVSGLTEQAWDSHGYPLTRPYVDGAQITYPDAPWVHAASEPIAPAIEYRHTLSTLINSLIEAGFSIRYFSDSADFHPNPAAAPGTWDHFTAFAPPWLTFWCALQPIDH
jgi:SAM-dependent methyltransferase